MEISRSCSNFAQGCAKRWDNLSIDAKLAIPLTAIAIIAVTFLLVGKYGRMGLIPMSPVAGWILTGLGLGVISLPVIATVGGLIWLCKGKC